MNRRPPSLSSMGKDIPTLVQPGVKAPEDPYQQASAQVPHHPPALAAVGGVGAHPHQLGQPDNASFRVTDQGSFHKGKYRITEQGVFLKDSSKAGQQGQVSELSLSDFEFLEVLGKGSGGQVNRAVHKQTGTVVAIKTINVFDDSRRQQVLPELDALLGCNCPFFVTLYDAFFSDKHVFIAMEFMNAGNLDSAIKRSNRVEESVLAVVLRSVLLGLHYLHNKKKQIHRDVKPENILCNSNGEVKLADFGISRRSDQSEALGTWVGTATYMSPERMNGSTYNAASDIWGVGVVAIECLTGKHPFFAADSSQFMDVFAEVSDPRAVLESLPSSGCSPEFTDFVAKCLTVDSSQRPSADSLLVHPWQAKYASVGYDVVANWLQSSECAVLEKRMLCSEFAQLLLQYLCTIIRMRNILLTRRPRD